MNENEINAGDVVRLKSGGPAMTVESVKETKVAVVWIDKAGAAQRALLVAACVDKEK